MINAFHPNLWVDESYSVVLSKHSLSEIWNLGGVDVHPPLYYFLLHIILLFVKPLENEILTIIIARICSSIPTIILGIIGYTHIKKDYGDIAGIVFSVFCLFMPVQLIYSQEIRMYTLLTLLVTLTSIYAQRFIKESSKKNIILFTIFSLASAYTHYYGVLTSVLINIILYICILIKKDKKIVKTLIISTLFQVITYLPWIPNFIIQVQRVSTKFWVWFSFPKTIFETFEFQFTGNNICDWNFIPPIIGILFGITILIYSTITLIKKKYDNKKILALFTIGTYLLVFLIVILISFKKAILYPRYILAVVGLIYLFVSVAISKSHKSIIIIICSIVMILGFETNVKLIRANYDESNMKQVEYLKDNIEKDDIIIYYSLERGSVFTANFPKIKQFLYNETWWPIESYKAYSPILTRIHSLSFLNNHQGIVWIIDDSDGRLSYQISSSMNVTILDQKTFYTAYQKYSYIVTKIKVNNTN